MSIWTAARRHKILVLVGLITGVALASATVFKLELGADHRPRALSLRSPGNYVTSLDAVIDTSGFGLGSSDTDIIRLAYVAPTYAELLTSDSVLRSAEATLGGRVVIRRADTGLGKEVDAQVSAQAVGQSPIVKLTVEAKDGRLAIETATAVISAFQEYLESSQSKSRTLADKRLTILVMGQPTTPKLASNRQREFAVLLFCLPVAFAVAIAFRIENSETRWATDLNAGPIRLEPHAEASLPAEPAFGAPEPALSTWPWATSSGAEQPQKGATAEDAKGDGAV